MMNPETYCHEAERMEQERLGRIQEASGGSCKTSKQPSKCIRETLPSGCILYRLVWKPA